MQQFAAQIVRRNMKIKEKTRGFPPRGVAMRQTAYRAVVSGLKHPSGSSASGAPRMRLAHSGST